MNPSSTTNNFPKCSLIYTEFEMFLVIYIFETKNHIIKISSRKTLFKPTSRTFLFTPGTLPALHVKLRSWSKENTL